MKILLINPPYQTLTSNLGVGHQIPLGLLMVGGALLDEGHEVRLLDAECHRLGSRGILAEMKRFRPQVVMTGHAGSTSAHPVCVRMLGVIKESHPDVTTVYGGVYPTYHAADILSQSPAVDVIVRGEGETTAVELVKGLGTSLAHMPGLALRIEGKVVLTADRALVRNLDAFRVGWELIEDWDDYRCFGLGRAAIAQFSRGCPHRCTYCGQHSFWGTWRHRQPLEFADEIEWLYRTHDVRFVTLADENPTTLQAEWCRFLESMASRRLPVRFFATIRATDIVRDADMLSLYRDAGVLYVLMGIESTNPEVLRQIRKGSTPRDDYQACRLLKQHGIFSVLGHIVGLGYETAGTFRLARRQLVEYDGDYLNAMYVTPHRWTPYAAQTRNQAIVQLDQQKWDYRHQVFAHGRLKPLQLFAAVKWMELCFHLRPRRLWTIARTRDWDRQYQLLWCLLHTALVWMGEIVEFCFATSFTRRAVRLGDIYDSSNKAQS